MHVTGLPAVPLLGQDAVRTRGCGVMVMGMLAEFVTPFWSVAVVVIV